MILRLPVPRKKKELDDVTTSLSEEKIALNGEKVSLEGDKSSNELSLGEKQRFEDMAGQAQEDYGNCAQKIPDYNNAIASKYADIDGLTLVIGHLSNIDQDYRGKAGTE